QVQTGPDGAAVGGAARGALAGVAIGAIAGDAGKGAAIGAASGAIAGHRASRIGRSRQQQANNQAAGQAEADMMNSFKKAYSACLQGKGYTVN
ncbi:MAG: glycine zipper family protein, partial [Eudoraea sp.]